ncbi:MAG: hypothetical protein ACHQF3_07335 [Alphaproteobacteria bacterium]
MTDLAFLVYGVVLLGLMGVPAALLLPPGQPARLSLAPIFGYCILAILAPNLLKAGLSMRGQLLLYGALAALGLACLVRRQWRCGEVVGGLRGEALRLAAAWCAAAVILSLPKWLAGEEYYAYLGNIWDYFNYVASGVIFAKVSPAELWGADIAAPATALRNPMLMWANHLVARPSVMMVFAALSNIFLALKVPLFELANAFMSLTLSLYLFSLYFLVRNATPAGPLARLVIPLTFVCGFWGGYLIDVDAWAQLSAVMLMPALFALGLAPPAPESRAAARTAGDWLRRGLGMSLLVGGTIYLYPEILPAYVAIYGAALLSSLWASGWHLRRLLPQFLAAGLGVLLALPYFAGTLGVITRQLHLIASEPKLSAAWFDYFHAFLLGGDDLSAFTRRGSSLVTILYKAVNATASLMGLYRLVPEESVAFGIRAIVAVATAGLVVALTWLTLASLKRRDLWLPAALLAGAALVVTLALQGNLYGAGKTFFWLSPFILLLLLLTLADPGTTRWQRLAAQVYVLLQAFSLLLRLHSVALDHGIPAARPYPGDPLPALKRETDINLAQLLGRLDRCRLVRVDLADPFLRHYVMASLFARDVPYFSVQEINSYYDGGSRLGFQVPAAAPDCTAGLGAPGSGTSGRRAFAVEPAAE